VATAFCTVPIRQQYRSWLKQLPDQYTQMKSDLAARIKKYLLALVRAVKKSFVKERLAMPLPLAAQIKQRLLTLVRETFNITLEELAVEVPPKTELGDLAFPIAFDLAKRIKAATGEKKNPRELAAKLSESLSAIPGVERVEVAGAGYLNIFFNR